MAIRLELHTRAFMDPIERTMADAYAACLPVLELSSKVQASLKVAGEHQIRVVLGGVAEREKWAVAGGALGFLALLAQGEDETASGELEMWFEVNEAIEIHVDVEEAARRVVSEWNDFDDRERAIDLECLLATLVHELFHAVDWVNHTGGATPLEVFDAGAGEFAVKAVLDAIEKTHGDEGDEVEDAVEREALVVAAAEFAGLSARYSAELSDHLSSPAAAPF